MPENKGRKGRQISSIKGRVVSVRKDLRAIKVSSPDGSEQWIDISKFAVDGTHEVLKSLNRGDPVTVDVVRDTKRDKLYVVAVYRDDRREHSEQPQAEEPGAGGMSAEQTDSMYLPFLLEEYWKAKALRDAVAILTANATAEQSIAGLLLNGSADAVMEKVPEMIRELAAGLFTAYKDFFGVLQKLSG